ncbi:MAG: TIM44-like domain-containing protein [Clostridia bacterium]|nr:TIM44-like domain-containing protein [Clostridia bacterium]
MMGYLENFLMRIMWNEFEKLDGYSGGDEPLWIQWTRPSYPKVEETDLARLIVKDSNFSPERFVDDVEQLFLRVTQAEENNDLNSIQPYITTSLYGRLQKRLRDYKKSHEKPVYKRMTISNAVITDYEEKQYSDYLEVTLQILMVHYVINCDTGKLRWKHSKRLERFQYQMEFVCREIEQMPKKRRIHCPHCGATIVVQGQVKCPYCKSIVTMQGSQSGQGKQRWKWLLNDISGGRCESDSIWG